MTDETHATPRATIPRAVLVAEDDAELRRTIAMALEGEGYLVSEARDGAELLEIVRAAAREDGQAPEVIIADVRMPGSTGLQALAELHALLHDTAILVITGYDDAATRAEARRLGASGVLRKPFDLDTLTRAVREMSSQR